MVQRGHRRGQFSFGAFDGLHHFGRALFPRGDLFAFALCLFAFEFGEGLQLLRADSQRFDGGFKQLLFRQPIRLDFHGVRARLRPLGGRFLQGVERVERSFGGRRGPGAGQGKAQRKAEESRMHGVEGRLARRAAGFGVLRF